jgi:hypothetical protein
MSIVASMQAAGSVAGHNPGQTGAIGISDSNFVTRGYIDF